MPDQDFQSLIIRIDDIQAQFHSLFQQYQRGEITLAAMDRSLFHMARDIGKVSSDLDPLRRTVSTPNQLIQLENVENKIHNLGQSIHRLHSETIPAPRRPEQWVQHDPVSDDGSFNDQRYGSFIPVDPNLPAKKSTFYHKLHNFLNDQIRDFSKKWPQFPNFSDDQAFCSYISDLDTMESICDRIKNNVVDVDQKHIHTTNETEDFYDKSELLKKLDLSHKQIKRRLEIAFNKRPDLDPNNRTRRIQYDQINKIENLKLQRLQYIRRQLERSADQHAPNANGDLDDVLRKIEKIAAKHDVGDDLNLSYKPEYQRCIFRLRRLSAEGKAQSDYVKKILSEAESIASTCSTPIQMDGFHELAQDSLDECRIRQSKIDTALKRHRPVSIPESSGVQMNCGIPLDGASLRTFANQTQKLYRNIGSIKDKLDGLSNKFKQHYHTNHLVILNISGAIALISKVSGVAGQEHQAIQEHLWTVWDEVSNDSTLHETEKNNLLFDLHVLMTCSDLVFCLPNMVNDFSMALQHLSDEGYRKWRHYCINNDFVMTADHGIHWITNKAVDVMDSTIQGQWITDSNHHLNRAHRYLSWAVDDQLSQAETGKPTYMLRHVLGQIASTQKELSEIDEHIHEMKAYEDTTGYSIMDSNILDAHHHQVQLQNNLSILENQAHAIHERFVHALSADVKKLYQQSFSYSHPLISQRN